MMTAQHNGRAAANAARDAHDEGLMEMRHQEWCAREIKQVKLGIEASKSEERRARSCSVSVQSLLLD